jgi:glycosyltransferase involved in cell wall biosynthesis
MRKALLYFTGFNSTPGGSEYLPLLLAAELQKTHDVTMALNWDSDVSRTAQAVGIPIDANHIKVVVVKPKRKFLAKIDSVLPIFSTHRLKALARDADICISAANIVDFGRPAWHFIYLLRTLGDNAFLDYVRHLPQRSRFSRLRQATRTFLAEKILRPMLGVRSTRKILADPRERILPNSYYVESVMREFYGVFNGIMFYPPTIFEVGDVPDVARNPLKVVYIGQIFPQKRITDIVAIVERAREISGCDLRLVIAGHLGRTAYVDAVKALAAHREWVLLVGGVYGDAKKTLLLSATYAIHAERDEMFGISVTEYLKAGNIVLVPDEGGTPEIVGSQELAYRTDGEAAQMLAHLLSDETFREKMRRHCAGRAKTFSRTAYMKRQRKLLDGMLKQ